MNSRTYSLLTSFKLVTFILAGLIAGQSALAQAGSKQGDSDETDIPGTQFERQERLGELRKELTTLSAELKARTAVVSTLTEVRNQASNTPISPKIESMSARLKTVAPGTVMNTELRNIVLDIGQEFFNAYGVLQDKVNPASQDPEDRLIREFEERVSRKLTLGPQTTDLYREARSSDNASITKEELDLFIASVQPVEFEKHKKLFLETFDAEFNRIQEKNKELAGVVENRRKQIINLQESIAAGQSQLDRTLLTYGLPAFGLMMLLILTVPRLYKDESLQHVIFSSGLILELFTVFLLTITILFLGLANKITGEILGTLLGGISGFVLGRTFGKSSRERQPQETLTEAKQDVTTGPRTNDSDKGTGDAPLPKSRESDS
jgi:hypothetical protein